MRQFSKLSLLLGPLLLVSVSGCATSGNFLGKSEIPKNAGRQRADRLLSVAQNYERAGKPELACRIYEHVAARQPDNTVARDRMEYLAQQGYTSGGAIRPGMAPAGTVVSSQELLASSHSKRKSVDASEWTITPSPSSNLTAAKSAPLETPSLESRIRRPASAAQQPTLAVLPEIRPVAESQPVVLQLPNVNDGWTATKLDRAQFTEVAPTSELVEQRHWGATNLVSLAGSQLGADLQPSVERLQSCIPSQRILGLLTLSECGPNAVSAAPAVQSLLEDENPGVAMHAASALYEITGDAQAATETLVMYLDHEEDEVVQLATYLLGKMGVSAIDAASDLRALRDDHRGVTSLHAAEALAQITPHDHRSIEDLSNGMSHPDPNVRWFAAVSLGGVSGDCESVAAKALTAGLRDQESKVRIASALSLGGLGVHAAPAISMLEQTARTDTPEVRSAAETALACLQQ